MKPVFSLRLVRMSPSNRYQDNSLSLPFTTGGQHQFDVIILATGFLPVSGGLIELACLQSVQHDFNFHVRGSGGRTMHQYYKEHGGPTAYYGTMTAGFPNLFILCGGSSTEYPARQTADILRRPEHGNRPWFSRLHGGSTGQLYNAVHQAYPPRPSHVF